MKLLFKLLFIIFISSLLFIFTFYILKEVFYSNSIIIPYSLKPFDICLKYPEVWNIIKKLHILTSIISYIIISNYLFNVFISKKCIDKKLFNKKTKNSIVGNLDLFIGTDTNDNKIFIPEKSLYQNIFITGTIGTGKTSSAMYPFTEQLIKNKNKIGILILDVKGNYYKQVLKYCKKHERENDIIEISINNNLKYNPLHKPDISPTVLANRLKTILLLFSKNNSDSYWLDIAEETIANAIKFCRIYNNGYVTFKEINNLIFDSNYYKSKITYLRNLFMSGKLSNSKTFDLYSSLEFFNNEFFKLDNRTLSIIKSEIGRITNIFTSEYKISKTFCPPQSEINFFGFKEVIQKGKIAILNMNIAEYRNLSKIIAAYLKLDFQTEVLSSLKNPSSIKTTAFICDEYHEYVTVNDADFFSQCREAKCINIVSTQSYTSLYHSLNNPYSTKVIIQSLVNKLWFRTDDIFTIEEIQKQIGKEEKIKISSTISENSRETSYDYFSKKLKSKNSNISESVNKYTQKDYVYDTNYFTQELETFSCIAFLSDGKKILPPKKIKLSPYFIQKNNIKGL